MIDASKLGAWDHDAWRTSARCRTVDSELFFPVGVTGDAEVQIRNAKRVCADCPVSLQCLEYALRTNQEYGVWGGRDEEERKMLRRIRRVEGRVIGQSEFRSSI